MAKKLFIGNLSYKVSEDELRELVDKHGEVASVQVICDRMSGRSKGFAFVELANDGDVNNVIEALNGTEFEGRNIVVNEARERTERPGSNFKSRDRY